MCTTCAKHNPGSKKKAAVKTAKKTKKKQKKFPPIITNQNYRREFSFKQTISRVLSWMIIYLVSLLPARSNGLPGGTNEAGRFIPPYLAFLPVGFAMPLMSPSERWALTLSRYLSLFLTRETTPPFHPYSIKKMERYIFCCTFLPVTGTPRYGALCPVELGLSSRPFHS